MTTLYQAIMLILDVIWFLMIAHIIMSWLINFQVLNLRQPLIAQLWDGLNRILEPLYGPIRRLLPNTGGLDLAPLVVFIGIIILASIRAASDDVATGVFDTLIFGGLGFVIFTISWFVLDVLTPGKLGDILAEDRFHPAVIVSATVNVVVGTIIAFSIY